MSERSVTEPIKLYSSQSYTTTSHGSKFQIKNAFTSIAITSTTTTGINWCYLLTTAATAAAIAVGTDTAATITTMNWCY